MALLPITPQSPEPLGASGRPVSQTSDRPQSPSLPERDYGRHDRDFSSESGDRFGAWV